MSNYYLDDWGFQIDGRGNLLDTDYNYQLELKYQREEAMAAQAANVGYNNYPVDNTRVYDSRMSQQPQQRQIGRHPSLNTAGSLNRGYPMEQEENIRTNYGSGGRHPALNKQPARTSSAKVLDLDLDHRDVLEEKEPVRKKAVAADNTPVSNKPRIVKPIDGVYHPLLLPSCYKQTKVYLPESEVEDLTIVYYKTEITTTSEEENDMDNRFGENYFGNSSNFIPVAIEKAEIVDINKKKDGDIFVLESSDEMLDQILYLVPTTGVEDDKFYMIDVYLASKYFNNTGKNLFIELASANVNSPLDLMEELEKVYDRYYKNEYTRNGIMKIDTLLSNALNTYIAAYSGKTGYYITSFMLGVKPMYEKIKSDIKDTDLRKNLLQGITTFLTNLMINIKGFKEEAIKQSDLESPELYCPTRELMIVSKHRHIKRELEELAKAVPNEYQFHLIDRTYTPYIHDMVTRVDQDKVIQKYNRLVFFTFDNTYSIIKSASGCYYIASFNRLVK